MELPDDVLTILEDFIREATVYALKPIGGPFETDLSIIELSFPFFQSCADILSKGEIIIECSVDSLYHQLEDIHLSPSGGQTRKYDAIFISNVPYVFSMASNPINWLTGHVQG